MMLKLKCMQNSATLDVTNNSLETVIFDLKNARNIRFKVNGLLLSKARHITAKFDANTIDLNWQIPCMNNVTNSQIY